MIFLFAFLTRTHNSRLIGEYCRVSERVRGLGRAARLPSFLIFGIWTRADSGLDPCTPEGDQRLCKRDDMGSWRGGGCSLQRVAVQCPFRPSVCPQGRTKLQRCSTHHPRAHAHTIHGTGRSAGATPRRLTRRGRPTPTAAAVHSAEAGARRPGLPAPTTSAHTTPPLYPPAYHTSPTGKRSSRSGKRAKWGEVKRVREAAIGVAAFRTGPGGNLQDTGWECVCRRSACRSACTGAGSSRVLTTNKYFSYSYT